LRIPTGFLLPPSLDEWLPERHLARFVVEVIDGLDLSANVKSYRGTGSAGYHPALLLGLLVYGYTTGVFSSRKVERATYDSVAFRFIAANHHPDHDTIATFRRRFLKDIAALFVRVLELAREMGLLRMGTVGLDGTKIHANASRHSALSYEHAGKIEAQLKAEVAELLARAEAADQADLADGNWRTEKIVWRSLPRCAPKLEARAKQRFEREMAERRAKPAAPNAALLSQCLDRRLAASFPERPKPKPIVQRGPEGSASAPRPRTLPPRDCDDHRPRGY
jgi:transposase